METMQQVEGNRSDVVVVDNGEVADCGFLCALRYERKWQLGRKF